MNIAVVDDDKMFIRKIIRIIDKICLENSILYNIDSFNNGDSFIKRYDNYHIVFLDIEMPMLDGIEVAARVNALKNTNDLPYIIFVTNKDNMVFTALKEMPYSFIRKIYLDEDIKRCILNINNKLQVKHQKYPIKIARKTEFIDLNSIIYLEKEKNYVLYRSLTTSYRERASLDEKEAELCTKGFIRIHVGYMVNIIHIQEVKSKEIILDNGESLPLSKKYKNKTQNIYFEWLVKMND